MDVIIYGAGKNGLYAKQNIEKYYSNSLKVAGFLDTYKKGEFQGLPIMDIEKIPPTIPVVIAIAAPAAVPALILEVYKRLRSHKIKNIYWHLKLEGNVTKRYDFFYDECVNMSDWGDNVLPHVEYHISDKCNLNCKGCTHFSPLFDSLGTDFEEHIEDLKKLKSKFTAIGRLDILGGEPLVNPKLGEYVKEVRRILPDSFVQIFTNGLLIPNLSDMDLCCIKDNHVSFAISEYKPTHKMIDKIVNRLNEYGIRYFICQYDSRQKFNKPISLSEHSKYPKKCISDGCMTLAYGTVAKCPTLMYIRKFNEEFGTSLPEEGILALDDYPNGEELLIALQKKVPLCKHCIECEMEWSVCGKDIKLEDFAVID